MARSVLPVAKGVLGVGVVALVAYVALSNLVQAQQQVVGPQQVVEPPPEGFVAPVDVDTAGLPGPQQPIFFRHDIHAGQYRMDCRYCHYAAEVSSSPGLPSISTCQGCHQVVGGQNPEVQKVQQAEANSTPPEWVEVHVLPPFVRFPHNRHVTANPPVSCQTCHGPIQEMPQVYQFAPLKMGWCLDCHIERGVTTDCTACHY